jgi:hypothetical protein
LCGMRALSPMLMMLMSSPHRIGSPNSYSEPLTDLPGFQTYVCGLASRWTVKPTLTTAHSGYRWGLCTSDGDDCLESQEEDTPKRIPFFKPMSWLGQIRTHRRDETWSTSPWQTFFSTSMGAQIPVIAEKPIATCCCRKFQLDPLGP